MINTIVNKSGVLLKRDRFSLKRLSASLSVSESLKAFCEIVTCTAFEVSH